MKEIPCAVPDSPDGVMAMLLEELAPLQLSVVFWRAVFINSSVLSDSSFPLLDVVQTSLFKIPS